MPQSAPELLTPRLRLRAHTAGDLDAAAAMWADPLVVRHIGGTPFSRSDVWARLLRYAGMWPMLGYGFWAVEARSGGDFLGDIGIMDARREIDPPIDAPEVGWAFASAAHGRGIATEALSAVLGWADAALAHPSTVALIDDGNAASAAVAAKFGFAPYASTRFGGASVQLLRRQRHAGGAFAKV